MMQQMKFPIAMIPAAPADYPFTPNILTDEFLSKIRHRVLEQKDVQQKPILTMLFGLEHFGTVMHSQMPMLGSAFNDMCRAIRQNIDVLFINEYTALDYLSGKGIVGSYIYDNIEMFKACGTVYQVNLGDSDANSTITHRESRPTIEYEYRAIFDPTIEYEYRAIFDYNPKPAYVDSVPVPEYKQLIDLNRRIQNFIYTTRIFESQKSKEYLHRTSLRTDISEFHSENGSIDKSGFYRNSNGYNGTVDGLLILIAPVRDTKVALVINGLYKTDPSSINRVQLFIKHRAENSWINHSDASGTWILDGVAEALAVEAKKFFDNIQWDLDVEPEPIAHQVFENMHYIATCIDSLAEQGVANSITDILPNFVLAQSHIDDRGNKLGQLFSFNVNNVVYDIKKTADGDGYVTWIGYRRTLTGYGYNPNSEYGSFIYKANGQFFPTDNDYITAYLMNELNSYLELRLPKLKEYVDMCNNANTQVKDPE